MGGPASGGEEAQDRCIPDIVYTGHEGHSRVALDVTVRGPHLPPVGTRVVASGVALRRAEEDKEQFYRPWMDHRGSGRFLPLAVEAYGGLGRRFVELLRDCGHHHAGRLALDAGDGVPGAGMARSFAQRVGVRLQQSQAQAFRASMARAGARDIELEADQAEAHRMVLDALLEVPDLLDAFEAEEEDGGLCFG